MDYTIKPLDLCTSCFFAWISLSLIDSFQNPTSRIGDSQTHFCVSTNIYDAWLSHVWVFYFIVKSWNQGSLYVIGAFQNLPPQNMLLWHYVELKTLEKEQMQEGFSDLPLYTKKWVLKFPMRKVPSLNWEGLFVTWLGVNPEMHLYEQTY